jgi:catechol 2,3-dioxygenase-like lactoylglutathione lyase family enzyme
LEQRYDADPVDVEIAFTGVGVSDLAVGQDFFERLLGKPPDVLVNEIEVMWRVNESAWLYVVVDQARAGRALAALSVADLDAALAELASRGLRPSKLEEHQGGARKAVFVDPDGNTAALIGVPASSQ